MSHHNPKTVGVTWSAGTTNLYQRSSWDEQMNKSFNPEYKQCGPPQNFNHYEAFTFRTNFDKKMLNKFDPEYRNSMAVQEAYQPRHSHLYDDPYMPWSYKTLQPDMH